MQRILTFKRTPVAPAVKYQSAGDEPINIYMLYIHIRSSKVKYVLIGSPCALALSCLCSPAPLWRDSAAPQTNISESVFQYVSIQPRPENQFTERPKNLQHGHGSCHLSSNLSNLPAPQLTQAPTPFLGVSRPVPGYSPPGRASQVGAARSPRTRCW